MKKKISIILLVTVITLLVGGRSVTGTYAMKGENEIVKRTNHQIISPLWNNIDYNSATISVKGTTLYSQVSVVAKNYSASITGTMYLERYSFGSWITVASWGLRGTGNVFLSKSYRGSTGSQYRTRVLVTVSGERATAISRVCKVNWIDNKI